MRIPRKKIALPELPFLPTDLQPIISEQTIHAHYYGHHKSYVRKFNKLLDDGGTRADATFNYSGHILHSLYWNNLAPFRATVLDGPVYDQIIKQFKTEANFSDKLISALAGIKGSGWALLLKDGKGKLHLKTITNHDASSINGLKPVLVLDAWEHAYYLDYQNDKTTFFQNLTFIINWDKVNQRYTR